MEAVEQTKYLKMATEFYSFYYATKIIFINYNKNDKDMNLVFPLVVNGAFTCELALKTLLLKLNIKYEKQHPLIRLFDNLPLELKRIILGYLCGVFQNSEEENLNKIIGVSDYFYEVRFVAEYTIAIDITFVLHFMEALYKIVKSVCGDVKIIPATAEENNMSECDFNKKVEEYWRSKIEKYKGK